MTKPNLPLLTVCGVCGHQYRPEFPECPFCYVEEFFGAETPGRKFVGDSGDDVILCKCGAYRPENGVCWWCGFDPDSRP